MFKSPKALFLALAMLLPACQHNSMAFLDASFTNQTDVTGNDSARAHVNFTSFTQPPGPNGNDDKLRITFTNPEGDTLAIVLSPTGGAFPVGSYYFDGTSNSFDVSVTVTFASGPETIQTSSTAAGFLNLASVGINEAGVITNMSGEFHVNFQDGGAGTGTISAK